MCIAKQCQYMCLCLIHSNETVISAPPFCTCVCPCALSLTLDLPSFSQILGVREGRSKQFQKCQCKLKSQNHAKEMRILTTLSYLRYEKLMLERELVNLHLFTGWLQHVRCNHELGFILECYGLKKCACLLSGQSAM